MRKILFLLLILGFGAKAQTTELSPQARISIITFGPWQGELYSAFGHSAIRVFDPNLRIDDAYNYGVFDFNQPNFYLNYTKGLLLFKLGVMSYPDLRDVYVYYNRSVTEQVLNLSPHQKQTIYEYLEWNALPENETYRYDYFYNNCASKIRDVFADVLKDSVQFDTTYIKTNYSLRQLTDLYLTQQPWGDLGIDICLGLPIDKVAEPYEYMFLPDYIESSFDHASVLRDDGSIPLVLGKAKVYVPHKEQTPAAWIHPWVAFGGFLLAAGLLTLYDWRRKKISMWFDLILFTLCGLIGILLTILWTATDHWAAAYNFNLLWALPTHVLVWLILRSKSARLMKKYFTVVTAIQILLLITWAFLPQQMNLFLIPLVVVLALRSYTMAKMLPVD